MSQAASLRKNEAAGNSSSILKLVMMRMVDKAGNFEGKVIKIQKSKVKIQKPDTIQDLRLLFTF